MKVTNANRNNIKFLIEEINNEFVVKRKKKVHIVERYPGLFDESNYRNIYILNENSNHFASIIIAKTVDIVIKSNRVIKAFFVGAQMTPKQHQGKGYGKYLFTYVTEKHFNNGFDIGVGWTRLQSFYPNLGWQTFENGVLVELSGFKKAHEINGVYQCNCSDSYAVLDKFRIKQSEEYIIRKNANGTFNGFGTIYSPAESIYCLYTKNGADVSAYLYGATNSEAVYIYETKYEQLIDFEKIVSFVFAKNPNKRIFINIYQNDPLLDKLNCYFDKTAVYQPILSIYAYRDKTIFSALQSFYIPFTDRI